MGAIVAPSVLWSVVLGVLWSVVQSGGRSARQSIGTSRGRPPLSCVCVCGVSRPLVGRPLRCPIIMYEMIVQRPQGQGEVCVWLPAYPTHPPRWVSVMGGHFHHNPLNYRPTSDQTCLQFVIRRCISVHFKCTSMKACLHQRRVCGRARKLRGDGSSARVIPHPS